jgi:Zn-dependent protease with chaperone function
MPLDDSGPKKARAARLRGGELPAIGANARGVTEAVAPMRKTLTVAQILGAFGEAIEPVRPTALYRLWIVLVAGVMILLPLLYVGMIGLVVAGMMFHAVRGTIVLQAMGRGRHAALVVAVVYVGPLLAGAVVVAFMIKPLFARPARGFKARTLDPKAEPLLHAFVDGVCRAVGAPRPTRIEVDCQVNASARREGGVLSLFGRELVLTVGLPIAAGLSLKQLAGVLAHEFGHFSQGAAMRLSALIRKINRWFACVVYERDQWDESLTANSNLDHNVYVAVMVVLARSAVWLTRRILWVLMYLGHMVSSFLMRQMEYDADRYAARLVGAETFAQTSWRSHEMTLAANGAFADLRSSWQQRRLPADFPSLVLANVPQIPKEALESYRASVANRRTGLFDTHPCEKDRVASAQASAPGEGVFQLEGPATDVFADFDALAKDVSFEMYQSQLGPEIAQDQLFAVSELVEVQAATQEGFGALQRIFSGQFMARRGLPLPAKLPSPPADAEAGRQALIELRTALEAACAAGQEILTTEAESLDLLSNAEAALVLLHMGVGIKPWKSTLKTAKTEAAESTRNDARSRLVRVNNAYEVIAQAAARRLALDLALLEVDDICDRIPEGRAVREEARAVYRCAAHLGGTVALQIGRTCTAGAVFNRVAQLCMASKYDPEVAKINAMMRAGARLHEQLLELRRKVGDQLNYPFELASEDTSLSCFAFPSGLPGQGDVGTVWEVFNDVVARLEGLYCRALGRLAVAAEEVERVLSLPSLPYKPPEESRATSNGAA